MSEMKVYHHELRHNEYDEFYLKYEADKVIEELKESVKGLILDNYLKGKELRHLKYKRCLSNAKWCEMSAKENDTRMCLPDKCKFTKHEEYLYFVGYYHKWHKRWLKLAEKFKEV